MNSFVGFMQLLEGVSERSTELPEVMRGNALPNMARVALEDASGEVLAESMVPFNIAEPGMSCPALVEGPQALGRILESDGRCGDKPCFSFESPLCNTGCKLAGFCLNRLGGLNQARIADMIAEASKSNPDD